jgi:hypothetical protein
MTSSCTILWRMEENMNISKPYYLTYRPNIYNGGSANLYMNDDRYLPHRWQVRKAVELLYEDLKILFNYIEPCDANKNCYSFRTYEMLLRICTEIESQMKRILENNGYTKKEPNNNLNMEDYSQLNKTHFLSDFEVIIPNWTGNGTISPFQDWKDSTKKSLHWYQSYNKVKHNRHSEFKEANLENTIHAFCGLLVIMAAQFYDNSFADPFILNSYGFMILDDRLENAIGAPFRIKFPVYPDKEKYNFNWDEIKNQKKPYRKLFTQP